MVGDALHTKLFMGPHVSNFDPMNIASVSPSPAANVDGHPTPAETYSTFKKAVGQLEKPHAWFLGPQSTQQHCLVNESR